MHIILARVLPLGTNSQYSSQQLVLLCILCAYYLLSTLVQYAYSRVCVLNTACSSMCILHITIPPVAYYSTQLNSTTRTTVCIRKICILLRARSEYCTISIYTKSELAMPYEISLTTVRARMHTIQRYLKESYAQYEYMSILQIVVVRAHTLLEQLPYRQAGRQREIHGVAIRSDPSTNAD